MKEDKRDGTKNEEELKCRSREPEYIYIEMDVES